MKTTNHLLAILILLTAGLMSTGTADAQRTAVRKNDLTTHRWTNGFSSYKARRIPGGNILFEGGNLHEGGETFLLTPQGGDFYRLALAPDRESIPIGGEPGNVVRLRSFGQNVYLIVYSAKGTPLDVLASSADLRRTIEDDLNNYYLAGQYRTEDGHVIDFKPGRRTATGLPGTNGEVTYTFGEEFQTPTTVICLPDGNAYRVLKTDDGLYIYKSNLNDGNWEDAEEALVSQARRIKYYSPDGSSDGFYPVTAHQPLTRGILGQLTVAELRLMRNEIYARRGLRFNSPDLRERFEGQAWYKPDTDDISTRLTELDAINIELIRQAEIMEE